MPHVCTGEQVRLFTRSKEREGGGKKKKKKKKKEKKVDETIKNKS